MRRAPPRAWPVEPVVHIELATASTSSETLPRSAEIRGLVTGLLELGLTDLEGVIPRSAAAPSVAMQHPLTTLERTWTVTPTLDGTKSELIVSVEVCDPWRNCSRLESTGPRAEPQVPVAQALRFVAAQLGRWPSDLVLDGWASPLSRDDYAILLAGRGAASAYGISPAAEGMRVGDKRNDPIDRAVYVDPFIASSGWLLCRRDAARGELDRARVPLTRARASRPWSALLAAEDAALADQVSKPAMALRAWREVARMAPYDARFLLPTAAAMLRAGEPREASDLLDHLPADFQEERAVVELRVAIADAVDDDGAADDLLARWQVAAPNDPEPVRRRVALRVLDRRYAEALKLTPELTARGAGPEADRLTIALGAGAGDWEATLGAAERLGRTDVVDRVRARQALERDPANVAAVGDATDPVITVARGWSMLAAGRPADALAEADRVLQRDPWSPRALALRIDALEALDREEDASAAARRLAWVDPESARAPRPH